ncbi:MAG: CRISPR-associated protein Cas4 [Acidobacteria bacterium]|nr:MAG: CRISPR-associated protein Cas4 [Acidobacteriota bacterium]
MFSEDSLVPISALQHLVFCERQAALIYLERQWADNRLTVEGSHLHAHADELGRRSETRGEVRICRGLALRSLRLGLVGRADVVELLRLPEAEAASGAALPGVAGRWRPFPVEYKRGKPKRDTSDKVQLCAQALCLEEMLDVAVPEGALYYGRRKRRYPVSFDAAMRQHTEATIQRLHRLFASGQTPRAKREPKCSRCSLLRLCLPDAMAPERSAAGYLEGALRALAKERG